MKEENRATYADGILFLGELRDGDCVAELYEKVKNITAACVQTGKKGELILKLSFSPQGMQVIIKDDFKEKVPQFTVQPTVMFADSDGNITRRSPRQMSLGDAVKVKTKADTVRVDGEEESVRVNPETGEVIRVQ